MEEKIAKIAKIQKQLDDADEQHKVRHSAINKISKTAFRVSKESLILKIKFISKNFSRLK